MEHAGIDGKDFRHIMSRFASGVTVLATTDSNGRRWGMTASAFSSLSLNPPLILVCINRRAGSFAAFDATQHFSVNFLAATQQNLSNHFAAHAEDKFAGIEMLEGLTDAPLLAGTLGFVECARHAVLDGGDHIILIGRVINSAVHEGAPLLYFDGKYQQLVQHPQ